MKELNLPYNFVPLSPAILQPAWADKVSHDHPFRDGLSGEMDIAIEVETPLCVGSIQKDATESKARKDSFFRDGSGSLSIPGSSLKGMIRNIVEIASFGAFSHVDDIKPSVRDLTASGKFYRVPMGNSQAGWLTYTGSKWRILACSFGRVHQSEILGILGVKSEKWNLEVNRTARSRYEKAGGLLRVAYSKEAYKFRGEFDAKNLRKIEGKTKLLEGEGEGEGYLVMTGQPSDTFHKKEDKKRDFIFFGEKDKRSSLEVSPEVMAEFESIHAESDEWDFWREKLKSKQLDPGIPVFYLTDANRVTSLGLSMMYRMAFNNSLHDAIENTNPEHLSTAPRDLASLIFGSVDEDDPSGRNNMRGRVNFSNATILNHGDSRSEYTNPMILMGPKPSFYLSYVDQDRGDKIESQPKTLMDQDAELSGWKRYPVRGHLTVPEVPEDLQDKHKIQTTLETLPVGTRFTSKIRFHNLLPVELGALIWAINLGGGRANRHCLGAGKPFGFGQIKITINKINLSSNSDTAIEAYSNEKVCLWARLAYEEFMGAFWAKARPDNDSSKWEKSPQIVQFLAMSDSDFGSSIHWDPPTSHAEFKDAKKRGDARGPYKAHADGFSPTEAVRGVYRCEHPGDLIEIGERADYLLEKTCLQGMELLIADMDELLSPDEWNPPAFEKLDEHIRDRILATPDQLQEVPKQKLIDLIDRAWAAATQHKKQKQSVGKAIKKLRRLVESEFS